MCVLTLYVPVCRCGWFEVRCTSCWCVLYLYVVRMCVESSDMGLVW